MCCAHFVRGQAVPWCVAEAAASPEASLPLCSAGNGQSLALIQKALPVSGWLCILVMSVLL